MPLAALERVEREVYLVHGEIGDAAGAKSLPVELKPSAARKPSPMS